MATYATGITATWNGVSFGEITDLSWSYGGSPSKGRTVIWTDDCGSATITCLGVAGVSSANYGVRADLSIAGPGATLTCKAVYEGVSVAYELNGVQRYTVTFKLLDG